MKNATKKPSVSAAHAATGASQHTANYQSQAIARGKAVSFGDRLLHRKASSPSSAVKLCTSATRMRFRVLDRIWQASPAVVDVPVLSGLPPVPVIVDRAKQDN